MHLFLALVNLLAALQVVILGAGSIIGDMSLQAGAKRSATVVALTELVTFKVGATNPKLPVQSCVLLAHYSIRPCLAPLLPVCIQG